MLHVANDVQMKREGYLNLGEQYTVHRHILRCYDIDKLSDHYRLTDLSLLQVLQAIPRHNPCWQIQFDTEDWISRSTSANQLSSELSQGRGHQPRGISLDKVVESSSAIVPKTAPVVAQQAPLTVTPSAPSPSKPSLPHNIPNAPEPTVQPCKEYSAASQRYTDLALRYESKAREYCNLAAQYRFMVDVCLALSYESGAKEAQNVARQYKFMAAYYCSLDLRQKLTVLRSNPRVEASHGYMALVKMLEKTFPRLSPLRDL